MLHPRILWSWPSGVLLALLLSVTHVQGSLYPTLPVMNTVYHGDQWNRVEWKESRLDTVDVSLDKLGPVSIDLFVEPEVGGTQ